MVITVQIVERNRGSYDLIKYWIESNAVKKFTFLPYGPVESAGEVFASVRPDILVIDLSVSKTFSFRRSEKPEQKPARVIVLAAPEGMEAVQQFIEIGISALLMKPVQQDPLVKAVGRVVAQLEKEEEHPPAGKFVTFKSHQSLLYLNELDIIFVESDRNSSRLTLKNGECQTVYEGISRIEQHLNARELLRVDKNTIVNLSRITYLGEDVNGAGCRLKLNNGSEIAKPLSPLALSSLYKVFPKKNGSVFGKDLDPRAA